MGVRTHAKQLYFARQLKPRHLPVNSTVTLLRNVGSAFFCCSTTCLSTGCKA